MFVNLIERNKMILSKRIIFLLIIVSSISYSQSIRENLDYINNQCNKYNSHNTIFNIDTENKALVIFDDFGTLLCYFEDVEFASAEENNTSIEVICLNGNECMDQKKHDEYFSFEKYSIELNGGNKAKVIEKLNEIKAIILDE